MRAGSGAGEPGGGAGGPGIEDSLVHAAYAKLGVTGPLNYFLFVDVSSATYAHTAGSAVRVAHATSKGLKTSSGAKWAVQLAVVLSIDGTEAELGILPGMSLSLRDSSTLTTPEQVIDLFPNLADLTVASGDLTKWVLNPDLKLTDTAVNTGITLEDARGASVVPAVGDLLIRVEQVSGAGSLDFAYGMQYLVE